MHAPGVNCDSGPRKMQGAIVFQSVHELDLAVFKTAQGVKLTAGATKKITIDLCDLGTALSLSARTSVILEETAKVMVWRGFIYHPSPHSTQCIAGSTQLGSNTRVRTIRSANPPPNFRSPASHHVASAPPPRAPSRHPHLAPGPVRPKSAPPCQPAPSYPTHSHLRPAVLTLRWWRR
ncbi:hypothetical protein BDD12DRAFT_838534 [Trichophaea hybrida]|nr:hypothetical protein BDD12DRAFT_838534 [Trichophaea hybrida]